MKKFGLRLSKVFMSESDRLGVRVLDPHIGFRPQFAKAIKVELADKTWEFGVLEILWQYRLE
jgi:hypothetical protein